MTIPSQVQAALRYVIPTDEPLYNYYFVEPPLGRTPSNETFEARHVSISDIRAIADAPTVDVEGFQLARLQSKIDDIYDGAQRKAIYDAEVEGLVKGLTGAQEVRVYNHFLRGEEAQRRDPQAITAPASSIHVDNTEASGPVWFDAILGEEAELYRGRRFAIINVWRPIVGPLKDRPLAVCDVRSTSPEDLIISEAVSRVDGEGKHSATGQISRSEVYSVSWNPQHRWYYVSDMQPDEVLLLKCYDSAIDGTSRFTPHTAFVDPTMPADAPPRASIEVRTLAIW